MTIDIAILVALTAGFVQALKMTGLPTKYAPIASLAFAVGINFFAVFVGYEASEILIGGLIAGLMASGLYDNANKGKEIVVDGYKGVFGK